MVPEDATRWQERYESHARETAGNNGHLCFGNWDGVKGRSGHFPLRNSNRGHSLVRCSPQMKTKLLPLRHGA